MLSNSYYSRLKPLRFRVTALLYISVALIVLDCFTETFFLRSIRLLQSSQTLFPSDCCAGAGYSLDDVTCDKCDRKPLPAVTAREFITFQKPLQIHPHVDTDIYHSGIQDSEIDTTDVLQEPDVQYCTINGFNDGRWEQTKPIARNAYELLAQHQYTKKFPKMVGNNGAYCGISLFHHRVDRNRWIGERDDLDISNMTGRDLVLAGQMVEFVRAAKIASYGWVPNSCELMSWDPYKFVDYLLRSEGGLVIVGDSLSEQHSQSLAARLGHLIHQTERKVIYSKKYSREITASKEFKLLKGTSFLDDMARRIARETGKSTDIIKNALLNKPIIRYIRNEFLLTLPQIREAFDGIGKVRSWPSAIPDFWGPLGHVEMIPGLVPSSTFQTLVVLNTGPHWRTSEFPLLSGLEMIKAYERMVEIVLSKFNNPSTSLPRHLSVNYRSTTPGHDNCHAYEKPASGVDVVELKDKNSKSSKIQSVSKEEWVLRLNDEDKRDRKSHTKYTKSLIEHDQVMSENGKSPKRIWLTSQNKFNWDWFIQMNKLWENAINKMESVPGRTFTYLDVYNHAAMRPDGHVDPWKGDCLHFCLPGVVDYWSELLWTLVAPRDSM